MPDTEPCEESIDRSDLNASAAAFVAQLRSFDVIIAIGHQERERGKAVEYLRARFRSGKSLKQLLQYEPCGQKRLSALDAADQFLHFRLLRRNIAPESQRPDARVHEDVHLRVRSRL